MESDVVLGTSASSLDQVRGVLFAAANRHDRFFESVSTQAIRFALARRGRDGSPVEALDELHRVGDVQRLGRGRWLPCVTAAVQVARIFVLLSGMPTRILSRVTNRHIFGNGSCRLVGECPTEDGIASQQFELWCGAPSSSAEWTTQILRTASYPLEVMSRLEYFNHWDRFVSHRWSYALPRSTPASHVVVAREKGSTGTLYFLCRVVDSTPSALHELSKDWNQAFRLGFGLRALMGNPATYALRNSDGDTCEVITPAFLPSREQKVLRALGPVVKLQGASQNVTTIHVAAWPQIELMLRALGLSIGATGS